MTFGLEAMLLRWAETSNGGATVTLLLQDADDLENFRSVTLARRDKEAPNGIAGQRFMVAFSEIEPDELPKDPPGDIFRPFMSEETLQSAFKEGVEVAQRIREAVMAQPDLGDPADKKGGRLAMQAGVWCHERTFQLWASGVFHTLWKDLQARGNDDEQCAVLLVREVCKVESRAQLDHDPEAEMRFVARIAGPYTTYLKAYADAQAGVV